MRLYTKRRLDRLLREARDDWVERLILGSAIMVYEHDFGTYEIKVMVEPVNASDFHGVGSAVESLRLDLRRQRGMA